jgi:hypothetical protein
VTEENSAPNQILCPYCKRLITLPAISFGAKEKCPHCDIEFVVSSRLIPRASEDSEDPMGGYELKTQIPEKAREINRLYRPVVLEEDTETDEGKYTWHPMATPSLGLLFKGTFLFPFAAGARGWYLMLLMFCISAEASASLAMYFAGFSGGWDVADKWIASMMFTSFSVLIGAFGILLASAICLTIMRNTSEGIYKFKDQQIGWFTEWFGETIYLVNGLFFGAAPVIILLFFLPVRPEMKLPIVLFSEIFLFPIFLMSSLECKSAVIPYSKPVWKSLWYAWHTWVLFYLLTLLIGETFLYLLRVIPFKDLQTELIFISVLLPFLIIVYFRLLGRLAWFCSGRSDEEVRVRRSDS